MTPDSCICDGLCGGCLLLAKLSLIVPFSWLLVKHSLSSFSCLLTPAAVCVFVVVIFSWLLAKTSLVSFTWLLTPAAVFVCLVGGTLLLSLLLAPGEALLGHLILVFILVTFSLVPLMVLTPVLVFFSWPPSPGFWS